MAMRKAQSAKRRALLDPQMHKALVDRIGSGATLAMACASVGIADSTLQNWMRRGFDEEQRLADLTEAADDNGPAPKPDVNEERYLLLYRELTKARADAGLRALGAVRRAEMGGAIIKETTRTYRGEDGQLVTEREVTRTAPDWRAAAWFLEKSLRAVYGKEATQVEIIDGAGGKPLGGGEGDLSAAKAEDLTTRILANIAALQDSEHRQITAGPGDGSGEVYDAEVVDDTQDAT